MYIKFKLTPGQMAPDGSTGHAIGDWIVWIGEEGTFPSAAKIGRLTPQDPTPITTYEYEAMTEEEIELFLNPPEPDWE